MATCLGWIAAPRGSGLLGGWLPRERPRCRDGRAGRAAAELAGWGGIARLDPCPLVAVAGGPRGWAGGERRRPCLCWPQLRGDVWKRAAARL